MSKSVALVLAIALSAGACSTSEPPQTIVAVVPAQERDAVSEDSPVDLGQETGQESTDTTDQSTSTTEPDLANESVALSEPESEPTAPAQSSETTAPVETAPLTTSDTVSVEDLLANALSSSSQNISARFNGGISMAGEFEGESIDMTIAMAGAFDAENEAMEMTIDLSSMVDLLAAEITDEAEAEMLAEFLGEPMQMRSIGSTAWIRWSLLDMFSGAEGKWLEMDAVEADMAPTSGSPADIVKTLSGATGEVTAVGPESIGGVETTHYSLNLDLAEFAGSLDPTEAAELQVLAADFGNLPLDLWIDADGLLRRLEMSIAPTSFTQIMGTADSFSATVWYEISDYGADVVITAPPAEEVISGDSLELF